MYPKTRENTPFNKVLLCYIDCYEKYFVLLILLVIYVFRIYP